MSLELALIAAVVNIKNCTRVGKFSNKSLSSFKNKNAEKYNKIVEELEAEITEATEWIEKIRELCNSSEDATVKSALSDMETFIVKKGKTEEEKVKLNKAIVTAFLDIEKALDADKEYEDEDFEKFKTNYSDCFQIIKTFLQEEDIQFDKWNRMLYRATDMVNDSLITDISLEIMKNRDRLEKQKDREKSINLKKTDEIDEKNKKLNNKDYQHDDDKTKKDQKENKFNKQEEKETVEEEEDEDFEEFEEIDDKNKLILNASLNQNRILVRQVIRGFENLAMSSRTNKLLRIETLKNDSQDAHEWFNKFERQTAQWTDEDRGYEVTCWFSDNALRIWELMPELHKEDYYEIKAAIIKKFRAEDHVYKSKSKFYSMKQQHNESVEEFVYRLSKCKNEWPDNEHANFERDLPHIFKNGVKPDIAAYLTSYKFSGLDDLLRKAKEVERILRKKEQDTTLDNAEIDISSITPSDRTKESIICYKCQKIGHLSKDCRTNNKSFDSKQSIFCLACGRNGHLILDCYKWKEQMNNASKTNNNKEYSNTKRYCKN
jgi:hypothetical protein